MCSSVTSIDYIYVDDNLHGACYRATFIYIENIHTSIFLFHNNLLIFNIHSIMYSLYTIVRQAQDWWFLTLDRLHHSKPRLEKVLTWNTCVYETTSILTLFVFAFVFPNVGLVWMVLHFLLACEAMESNVMHLKIINQLCSILFDFSTWYHRIHSRSLV